MEITTIGLDLSKSVFQIHGVDATGEAILTKRLRRKQMEPFFQKLPPCLVGIEACATACQRYSYGDRDERRALATAGSEQA